jgi:hypothetical protein
MVKKQAWSIKNYGYVGDVSQLLTETAQNENKTKT